MCSRRAVGAALALAATELACQQEPQRNGDTVAMQAGRRAPVRYIEPGTLSLAADVDAGRAAAGSKFVVIEITAVTNPRQLPLSFTVAYDSPARREVTLGTFSLFPPSNPGRFIIATQGQVKPGGKILLSLNPEGLGSVDDVRVGVGAIYLSDR